MATPTLSELLAEGQRQLATERAAEAARVAVETARAEAAQQARRAEVLVGLATIVPEALMPFVQIDVYADICLQYGDLVLPGCTPIRFCFDSVSGKRCDPWHVARAQGTQWTGRNIIVCDDLLVALAHAAEQGALMLQAQAEWTAHEARKAEDVAYAQATGHAEPVAVPLPTLAEQLEALVRQIVREELCCDSAAEA